MIRWRGLAPILLVVLSVMIIVPGCGGTSSGDTDKEPGQTSDEAVDTPGDAADEVDEASGEQQSLDISNWSNPRTLKDLTDRFQELVWSWSSEDESSSDQFTISYQVLGSDTVAGNNTTKLQLNFDDQQWLIWIDSEGQVVQVEADGMEMTDELAGVMVDAVLMSVFWPFMMVETFDVRGILSGSGDWDAQISTTTRERFGTAEADVTRVNVTIGPPHTPVGKEVNLAWAIGDFGAFQMLVEWTTSGEAEGDFAFRMKVDKVVSR